MIIMKKLVKLSIATLMLGVVTGVVAIATTNTYAMTSNEEANNVVVDSTKEVKGYDVIKGQYTNDDGKTFPMYYSDGFFTSNAGVYQQHMATLAAELANASTTYKNGDDYSKGSLHIENALDSIGFKNRYASDTYFKKPTTDSIACVIADKKINRKPGTGMKYEYVVDITVRSAGYGAEWASNVQLGTEGEAKGFADAADQVVYRYFEEYKNANPNIEKALMCGKVAFFINGFSRGGATANLTAKRLVDLYQDSGNAVYAYCVEAPMGGIKKAIEPDKDYTGIHNVINPNDLVCYVAPAEMGFIRYGVDHYVCGTEADGIHPSNLFEGTQADNFFLVTKYDEQKQGVIDELKTMLNTEDVSDYTPYDVTWKKLDLRNFEISNKDHGKYAVDFISQFVRNLMYKNGKQVVTRADYAKKLEGPVTRFMQLKFTDNNVFDIHNITEVRPIFNAFRSVLWKLGPNVKVYSTGSKLEILWGFITGDKNLNYRLDMDESVRKNLATNVRNALDAQQELGRELDKNYPTGKDGALHDVYAAIYEGLAGGNNIDDFITLGYNINGIMNNHTMSQAIAFARTYDDWF